VLDPSNRLKFMGTRRQQPHPNKFHGFQTLESHILISPFLSCPVQQQPPSSLSQALLPGCMASNYLLLPLGLSLSDCLPSNASHHDGAASQIWAMMVRHRRPRSRCGSTVMILGTRQEAVAATGFSIGKLGAAVPIGFFATSSLHPRRWTLQHNPSTSMTRRRLL
jgi:hypothetical protein